MLKAKKTETEREYNDQIVEASKRIENFRISVERFERKQELIANKEEQNEECLRVYFREHKFKITDTILEKIIGHLAREGMNVQRVTCVAALGLLDATERADVIGNYISKTEPNSNTVAVFKKAVSKAEERISKTPVEDQICRGRLLKAGDKRKSLTAGQESLETPTKRQRLEAAAGSSKPSSEVFQTSPRVSFADLSAIATKKISLSVTEAEETKVVR